ncbi:MAG: hypothetical protein PVJ53_05935 [Desulfobacterales bacterium]|jgi:hypothetical protein
MPTAGCYLLAAVLLMAGCGPRLATYWPDYSSRYTYTADEKALPIDEPFLNVRYEYTLPVYTPVTTYRPPRLKDHAVPDLVPGQRWMAWGRLDQDILVLHPPAKDHHRAGAAIGLAIHRDGRLFSTRPWYGLDTRDMISQPPWLPPAAPLFTPAGKYFVDCLESDLVYHGRAEAGLVFQERAYKCASAVPLALDTIEIPLSKPSTLHFHRLRIEIRPDQDGGHPFRVFGTVHAPTTD